MKLFMQTDTLRITPPSLDAGDLLGYDEFRQCVIRDFLSYAPKQFRKMQIHIFPIPHINGIHEILYLSSQSKDKRRLIFPSCSINQMYEDYLQSCNYHSILQTAASTILKYSHLPPVSLKSLFRKTDKITFQLVNTLQNKELLEVIPHREFLDLSIIYRWIFAVDDNGITSTIITNELLHELGISEETLYELANHNTSQFLPATVFPIKQLLQAIFSSVQPNSASSELDPSQLEDVPMFVISNPNRINGSAAILNERTLHDLALQLRDNLYLLPSSVHEFMVIPATDADPEYLAQVVMDINYSQLNLYQRLSNQVYYYDRIFRRLSQVPEVAHLELEVVSTEL